MTTTLALVRVPQPRLRRLLRRRVLWVVCLSAVVIALRMMVLTPLTVRGESMEPTLGENDVVLVARFLPNASAVRRGDLVVLRDPEGDLSLKRVVGLPGQRVAIRDAVLEVDGIAPTEPYVDHSRIDSVYFGPMTVPAGSVFLMGDNRANSIDSRDYGALDLDRMVGRVVLRLWPPGAAG